MWQLFLRKWDARVDDIILPKVGCGTKSGIQVASTGSQSPDDVYRDGSYFYHLMISSAMVFSVSLIISNIRSYALRAAS